MADSSNNHQNKKESESMEQQQVGVIIVPFPAQGHLNQLLQLSCLISSYGLPVHYLGSATHNRQARIRANGLDPLFFAKIHFHDLPTPDFASPEPDPNASNKHPVHLLPSWDATLALRQPIAAVLQSLSSISRRIVIIHDPLMAAVVQDAASVPNAEAYVFNCISAYTILFSNWESVGKPPPLNLIQGGPKGLPSMLGCLTDDVNRFIALQVEHLKYHSGEIYNTSRLVEGTYLDLLASQESRGNKKQWAIGPILPVKFTSSSHNSKCLEWLDKQPSKSVIYVSFGSSTSLSDAEVKELAMGLEQSRQRFIWVLRDADKGDIFAEKVRKIALPEGFEARTQANGIIVRDWAPQPEILAHPSTGGFMSHCGWNSCMESITLGVPIAAWPMHSDQAWNTPLITDILKIGLVVRDWALREEPVMASAIADCVRRLMESEEGSKIRKRAEELGDAVRKSAEEGGVSRLELESFIVHLTR